ncbi:MAG TPA: glycosyltransferase family 2 protein [Thermoanaerobaculia bacterium]|jgi:GT2 family glycosyltransferase|nr:glycosyltransferase family 2 protein [Thermoanaerobaculia bacterium]
MISLLVVNFRSAALAANAIRTAREAASSPLQVVVVDNSCDAREADALRGIADTLIVSETNRGYAGGINAGRRACEGEVILISNPDVIFAPQSLDLLANALDRNTAVAGPALFWDDAHQWHLPPGDLLTAPQKLDQILAGRSREWRAQRDRRRFQQRVAFWSLDRTTPVRMLSGALMAVRARDFDDLEGFDERFPLYFEETDFLRRVAQRRKRIAYVPAARCRHLYNQSAAQTSELAAARYAESEWKYLEKWNGPWLARTLKNLERRARLQPAPPVGGGSKPDAQTVVTEASPLADFETAAGYFGYATDVPPEVRASLGGTELYLRVVARGTAEVLATYKITP